MLVTHIEYLCSCGVQGTLGVIPVTCCNVACNSKTPGHRAKWIEIWYSSNTGNKYVVKYLLPCIVYWTFWGDLVHLSEIDMIQHCLLF